VYPSGESEGRLYILKWGENYKSEQIHYNLIDQYLVTFAHFYNFHLISRYTIDPLNAAWGIFDTNVIIDIIDTLRYD